MQRHLRRARLITWGAAISPRKTGPYGVPDKTYVNRMSRDRSVSWLILHAVPASRGVSFRAACGKRRASTVAGPRLMQGKRKRRHLHPVAVYFKGIIRRLPVVFRLSFRRQTVQPAPAFLLRCGFGDALASSAFRPAVVSARRKPELR